MTHSLIFSLLSCNGRRHDVQSAAYVALNNIHFVPRILLEGRSFFISSSVGRHLTRFIFYGILIIQILDYRQKEFSELVSEEENSSFREWIRALKFL